MKRLFAIVLVLVMMLSLLGCQTGPEKPLYGLILTEDTPYPEKIREGFQTAADELGAKVVVIYAATVEEQVAAIEKLEKKGVKGIVIQPAAATGLRDALRNAKSKGITVVSIDSDTEGSHYFADHGDLESSCTTILDAVYDLTGGEGQFAVIASAQFSGFNAWVNTMEALFKNEKYSNMTWVETQYCFPDITDEIQESTAELASQYPDLEVICCPDTQILQTCSQTLQTAGSAIKTTGLGLPSLMKDLVEKDSVCPYFYFWNPVDIGYSAACVLNAALEGNIGEIGTSFTGENGHTYPVLGGYLSEKRILIGPPYRFNADNISQWAEIC